MSGIEGEERFNVALNRHASARSSGYEGLTVFTFLEQWRVILQGVSEQAPKMTHVLIIQLITTLLSTREAVYGCLTIHLYGVVVNFNA